MVQLTLPILLSAFVAFIPKAAGHASIWHPSMYGFNVTQQTFPYDNRPVAPLTNFTFEQWWFHGHLDYPPNPGDYFELPAGQNVTSEIACDKSATSFFASSEGGNIQNPNAPNDPCPGSPPSEYHTTGISDVKGCALAIAYKSNVSQVQPDDFAVFSVNQTCVWNRFTDFSVPERMPPCPEGGCICSFFWIHSADSGGEQNFMNGFKCNVTSSTSTTPIAKSQVARRCGADPTNLNTTARTFNSTPGNCTYGAKQPLYWFQAEQNNMFEGTYSPPFYTDLYNFLDGAQNDIFEDSYVSMPVPGPNQTALPVLANLSGSSRTASPTSSSTPTSGVPPSSASTTAATSATPSVKTCTRKSSSSLLVKQGPDLRRSGLLLGLTKRSRKLNLKKRGSLWRVL